jgi:hypothetical protein
LEEHVVRASVTQSLNVGVDLRRKLWSRASKAPMQSRLRARLTGSQTGRSFAVKQ